MAAVFQGEYGGSLDEKGRVAVPVGFRDLLQQASEGRAMLTYNPLDSGSLWLFALDEWARVRAEVMALNSFEPAHRQLQRRLVGAASEVTPDGSGRIQIPQTLRDQCFASRKLVFVGLGSKVEIWDEVVYRAINAPLDAAALTDAMRQLRF